MHLHSPSQAPACLDPKRLEWFSAGMAVGYELAYRAFANAEHGTIYLCRLGVGAS